VATSRAAIPDGTYCSPTVTPPLPTASMAAPMISAERHWRRLGRSLRRSPRRTASAYIRPPAMRNRTDAISSGGMVSMATRMA